MDLLKYDEKHVRVEDIYGGIHTGVADFYDSCYCADEFGTDENAVRINGFYIYESQIVRIEVGFSVLRACWGQGYATEALMRVLEYLTENEAIPCVTAWCAAENTASRRVLEKSGMQLVSIEKGGLTVGDKTYDKLNFEYRAG